MEAAITTTRKHKVENDVDSKDSKRPKPDSVSDSVLQIQEKLCKELEGFDGGINVSYVYNPLIYAAAPHEQFVRRFCNSTKDVLFLGMNPGPFGMAQTGVPFGEVGFVKDWLQITGNVVKPENEHPKRPIVGFDCKRSEVSGARLWKFAQTHFGTPDKFLAKSYIYNYCPLVFMSDTGKNVVPGGIPITQRKVLFQHCDNALLSLINVLNVDTVVGIGKFCYDRAKACLKDNKSISVFNMMHPSPASPAANRDWAGTVLHQLKDYNVWEKLF